MGQLDHAMKTYDQFQGKLRVIPRPLIEEYYEELQKTLEASYKQIENKRQEQENEVKELKCREEQLQSEWFKLVKDRHQLEDLKDETSGIKTTNELLTLKTYQNMLKLVEKNQRLKVEYDKKITALKKELELGLSAKDEEMRKIKEQVEDFHSDTQCLITRQRMDNDQIQEARKALINELKNVTPVPGQKVYVKRMGDLNVEAFCNGVKRKRSADGEVISQNSVMKLCSLWESHIRDPSWFPFKVVEEKDGLKELLNEEDEKLKTLKNDLGEEAYQVVTTALKEMNEYNRSGRYPVECLYNGKSGKEATIKEGIEFLIEQHKPPRMKRRG